jgi:hypothetical protein
VEQSAAAERAKTEAEKKVAEEKAAKKRVKDAAAEVARLKKEATAAAHAEPRRADQEAAIPLEPVAAAVATVVVVEQKRMVDEQPLSTEAVISPTGGLAAAAAADTPCAASTLSSPRLALPAPVPVVDGEVVITKQDLDPILAELLEQIQVSKRMQYRLDTQDARMKKLEEALNISRTSNVRSLFFFFIIMCIYAINSVCMCFSSSVFSCIFLVPVLFNSYRK